TRSIASALRPERCSAAAIATPPRPVTVWVASSPLNAPMGVRAAPTIRVSLLIAALRRFGLTRLYGAAAKLRQPHFYVFLTFTGPCLPALRKFRAAIRAR